MLDGASPSQINALVFLAQTTNLARRSIDRGSMNAPRLPVVVLAGL